MHTRHNRHTSHQAGKGHGSHNWWRLAPLLLALCGCSGEAPPVAVPTESNAASSPVAAAFSMPAAGLEFHHFNGAIGEFYFSEIMGPGAALFDFDNDGDLDAYLVQGAMPEGHAMEEALFPPPPGFKPGNRLFRNDTAPGGELRFVDVTDTAGVGDSGYGMGVAVADIDGDGDRDLYVSNFGPNVLYRNLGDGRFEEVAGAGGAQDERWSTSASFLDYDADGDLDLFVAAYVSFSPQYNKRCASTSGQRDFCGPQSYEPLTDRLFRNDGTGAFEDVSVTSGIVAANGSGLGVVSADLDNDGWLDIYVANDQLPNLLWRNRGDGTFEERGLLSGTAYNANGAMEASMGVTAGDFDGDGDEDLFMTHLAQQTNTLYLNDGAGTFMDVTDRYRMGHSSLPFTGFGAAWFDHDNDGLLDVYVTNGAVLIETGQIATSDYPYAQHDQLFHNDGDGFSLRDPGVDTFAVGRGAAFGDLDNDGDVDVLLSNNNGPAWILRNELGGQKPWLRVRLRGVTANRDGEGARVALLRPGQPPLWRRAHTDGSYLSASDIRVHFGLGDGPQPESVGVHWPGGGAEVWPVPGTRREIELTQGSGQPWQQ